MKLGRLPYVPDARDYSLVRVAALPEAPASTSYMQKARPPWDMYGNDRAGCCAFAALCHGIQLQSANGRGEVQPPTGAAIEAYAGCTGYDPRTGRNDNGTVMRQALQWFRKQGVGGQFVPYFVGVPLSMKTLRQAMALFGGLYVGVDLPLSAQNAKVWDVPSSQTWGPEWKRGSWGGHAVWFGDYDNWGVKLITWGAEKQASWAWVRQYLSEAWAVYSPLLFDGNGKSPMGHNTGEVFTWIEQARA